MQYLNGSAANTCSIPAVTITHLSCVSLQEYTFMCLADKIKQRPWSSIQSHILDEVPVKRLGCLSLTHGSTPHTAQMPTLLTNEKKKHVRACTHTH